MDTKPLTRLQFFSRIRKLGFEKPSMQLARNALTYHKDIGNGYVTVSIPKGHESTFIITGRVPHSSIYVDATFRDPNWGTPVVPGDLNCRNMLEVCLALLSGDITVS